MEIGMGAWATTHFNPELEVIIQGLSLDEEEALKNSLKNTKININRQEIGSWISHSILGGIITIYKVKGSYLLVRRFKDGGKLEETLIKKSSLKGMRFEQKKNPEGDYYIIKPSKNLEIWDKLGLIFTLNKISK